MKLLRIVLAISILNLFACGAGEKNNNKEIVEKEQDVEKSESEVIEEWETYSKDNFSIQYPDDWKLNESGQMGSTMALFSKLESKDDKFSENVNLIIQDLSAYNIDLDEYADISQKQVKDMLANAKILESSKAKAAGHTYFKIIYSGTQGGFKLKFVQYYWVEGKTAYVLTFTAEESQFDKYWAIGEKIMNSFKFN